MSPISAEEHPSTQSSHGAVQRTTADKIFSAIDSLSTKVASLAFVLILPMSLLITIGVVARYIFNSPIHGIDDIDVLVFFLVIFCGLSYCWTQNGHIRMELFTARAKGKRKTTAFFEVLASFCAGLFMVFMASAALDRTIEIFTKKIGPESPDLHIPYVYFYICMIMLASVFIVQLCATFTRNIIKMVKE